MKNDQLPSNDRQDLARQALIAAANFAAVMIGDYAKAHPAQAAALASRSAQFSVRVTNLLGAQPQVALVAPSAEGDIEIGRIELDRVSPARRTH